MKYTAAQAARATKELHHAVRFSTTTALRLLATGANLEARDEFGRTPLHYACAYGTAECLVTLCYEGANTEALDNFGKTPFDMLELNDRLKGMEADKQSLEDLANVSKNKRKTKQ